MNFTSTNSFLQRKNKNNAWPCKNTSVSVKFYCWKEPAKSVIHTLHCPAKPNIYFISVGKKTRLEDRNTANVFYLFCYVFLVHQPLIERKCYATFFFPNHLSTLFSLGITAQENFKHPLQIREYSVITQSPGTSRTHEDRENWNKPFSIFTVTAGV